MEYAVEMLVNGKWVVWARYEEGCMCILTKVQEVNSIFLEL